MNQAERKESSLLMIEPPLVVSPTLACVVGLLEAILLQQIHYWLRHSKNFKDGRYWVYNRIADWQMQFPFVSVATIHRKLTILRQMGILLATNYNDDILNHTLWYSIDEDALSYRYNEYEKSHRTLESVVDEEGSEPIMSRLEPIGPELVPQEESRFDQLDETDGDVRFYQIDENNIEQRLTTETTAREWDSEFEDEGTTKDFQGKEDKVVRWLARYRAGVGPESTEESAWRDRMGLSKTSVPTDREMVVKERIGPLIKTEQGWVGLFDPNQPITASPGVYPMTPPAQVATPEPKVIPPPGSKAEAQAMFDGVCDICGFDDRLIHKVRRDAINQLVRAMQESGYEYPDLDAWHRTIWLPGWPGNKGQRPTLVQLREGIGQLGQVKRDRRSADAQFKRWFARNLVQQDE